VILKKSYWLDIDATSQEQLAATRAYFCNAL